MASKTVQQFQKLTQEVLKFKNGVQQTDKAIDQLVQSMQQMNKLTGGSKKYGLKKQIAFPSPEKIENFVKQLKRAAKVSPRAAQAAMRASKGMTNIGPVQYVSEEARVPMGIQVPSMGGMGNIQAQLQGTLTQYKSLKRAIGARGLTQNLQTGVRNLLSEYAGMNTELAELDVKLDAVNKAWSIQAQIVEKLADGTEILHEKQARVSAETGKIQEPGVHQALKDRMDPRQLKRFDNRLSELGFKMSDLNSVSTDAVNGITRFSFQTQEAGEGLRTASFHVDRLGRTLGDTSTRFRSFNDMIARNIAKVAEWAVAVGVVFGAWSQAQQMVNEMVQIQDRMAAMAVVSEDSLSAMGKHFDNIATIAKQTGSDLKDVMDAMKKSMQISGTVEGASETEASFRLLSDAATYAKLAGIDTKESMDILTSSLRQVGDVIATETTPALMSGEKLLDKWVAVSREAQVSLLALGKGFATASAAATSAGVSIDEFNGLIATMAENTNLSAQQSANALRAVFSALEQPSTKKKLAEFGVAIQQGLTDQARSAMDVLEDINALIEEGALTQAELSEAGYALGGQGARRQAQVITLLKNLGRAQETATVSANAQGDAQEALAKRTQTLMTAVKNLGTSFSELAETLGGEGGALNLMSSFVGIADTLVGGIDDLTGMLDEAASSVIAFAAAWGIATKMGLGPRIRRMGTAIGEAGIDKTEQPQGFLRKGGVLGGKGLVALGGKLEATRFGEGIALSIMSGLATAATTQGDWAQSLGATIATGFGFAIGGGLGAMAGQVIGQSIVAALQKSAQIQEILGEPVPGTTDLGELRSKEARLEKDLEDAIKPSGTFGKAWRLIGKGLWETGGRGPLQNLSSQPGFATPPGQIAMSASYIYRMAREVTGAGEPRLERAPEVKAKLEEIRREIERQEGAQQLLGGGEPSEQFAEQYQRYRQEFMPGVEERMAEIRQQLPEDFASGQIENLKEFLNTAQRTKTVQNSMIPIMYALQLSWNRTGETVNDAGSEFEELAAQMTEWDDQAISYIKEQATSLIQMQREVEETGTGYDQLDQQVQNFLKTLNTLTAKQAQLTMQVPGFTDFSDMTQKQFDQIIARAREMQAQFGKELGIPDAAFQQIEEWAALVGENFTWVEGVMKQFVQTAKQEFEDLSSAQEDAFNVRRLQDIDPSRMQEIAKRNRYWVEYLSRLQGMSPQEYLNQEGEQFNLLLGKSNTLQRLYSTNQAMLFTLQDIKETEEKQLEGMWNIPEGSRFWVPITSMFYEGQGEGGYPQLPELLPPTEQTARHTGKTTEQLARELGLSKDQVLRLQEIITTLKGMGYDVRPAEEWSKEGALALIEKWEFPAEKIFAQVNMKNAFTKAMMEADLETLSQQGEYVSQAPEPERELPPMHLPTTLKGVDEFNNAVNQFSSAVTPAGQAYGAPTVAEEEPKRGPRAALADEEEAGIMQWLRNLAKGAVGTPWAPGGAPDTEPMPKPTEVQVDIPKITGDFSIRNVVTLDGQVIATYVQRVLEKALTDTIRTKSRRRTR